MKTMSRETAVALKRAAPPESTGLPTVRSAAGIAAQLRQAILDGVYLYGEKLPAERQLARALSSSRTTVREALRVLEDGKMVTRRVGSGTFVTFVPESVEEDISDIISPLELVEVRIAVEPQMMRLATLTATAKDIERMAEALTQLEKSGADPDHFTKWDRHFHQLLAEATRNPLMVSIYHQINHVRGHDQWNAIKDKVLTAERIADYNRQHRAIYEALCARNAEAGVRVITEHLRDARRHLVEG